MHARIACRGPRGSASRCEEEADKVGGRVCPWQRVCGASAGFRRAGNASRSGRSRAAYRRHDDCRCISPPGSVRGGGAEQGTGAADEGSREHSPASGHGRGSGNGNRGSWDRARSRRQRSPSATREPETADVAHATTRSPREPQTRDKIREGTSLRSREPSVRGSERRFTGNTGNLLDSASPYRDIRLADRGRAGNRARFAEIADSWTTTTTRIGAVS